jgi:hypothetical protein
MGKYDSSQTRVQPIFAALHRQDESGEAWLVRLLRLPRRAVGPETVVIPASLGQLVQPPQFEFPVDPPKSYVQWLIRHPQSLSSPAQTVWNKWCDHTQKKRRALLAGDIEVQAEATAELEKRLRLPRRAWWRFEGMTRVDCALLTDSTVVFVEGKRTETGPSRQVTWHLDRNQVLRVLDCAAVYALQNNRQHYFVFLVVESDLVEHDPVRQSEIEMVVLPDTVRGSLPHLTNEERTELLSHYLGVTTWQAIVSEFGLGTEVLLDHVGRDHPHNS